jgi:hypothetical protein
MIFYSISGSKIEEFILNYKLKPLVTFIISAIVGLGYFYLAGVQITWVKWLSSFGLATSIYDIVIKELLNFIKSKFTNGINSTGLPKS